MSINKDLLDQLMEGRQPGDLFGKDGVLQELTKALAERALRGLLRLSAGSYVLMSVFMFPDSTNLPR